MAVAVPSKDQQVAVYYEASTDLFHVRICLRGEETTARSEFSSTDAEEAMEWACEVEDELNTALGVCNYNFPPDVGVPDISNASMRTIREETAKMREEIDETREHTAKLKRDVGVLNGLLDRYRGRTHVNLREYREIQGCIRAVKTDTHAKL